MLGWRIFRHSFNMVLRNLSKALHIVLVPWGIALALGVIAWLAAGIPLEAFDFESSVPFPAGRMILLGLFWLALAIFTGIWVAIAWHRFILLEEGPSGLLPTFHQDLAISYFLRGLVIFVIVFLPSFLAGSVIAILAATESYGMMLLLGFSAVAGALFLFVFSYRLSVGLPAIAVGNKISVSESLEATKGATWTIVTLFLCYIGLSIVIELIGLLFDFLPLASILYDIVTTVFTSILGISILTTLYGYYIEKRTLG